MLFGRVKLGEARPQNVGLQIVSAGSDGTLLHLILHKPDFRPIISRCVAEDDDLEQRFVGFELDVMMELGNERAQFFEESNADLLEVLLGSPSRNIVRINGGKVGDVAIESNGPGLRGDLPFGSAKEDADVAAINGGDARGNGLGFEGMVDGGKYDGVVGNVNDGAATGEVGNDFVFLGTGGRAGCECSQENQGGANEEVVHEGRVAQRADCGLEAAGEWFPSGARFAKMKVAEREEEITMGQRNLKKIKHNGKPLEEILKAHEFFWANKEGGARADLAGADLSGADLRELNLAGAILKNANLEGSDLRGARLPGADLSGANLRKADLRKVDLTEAFLPGANLAEAQASGVEFFRCDLTGANFQKAILRNVNFRDAHLDGAKFAGADLGIAILRETDLRNVDLSGVDLSTTLMPPGWGAKKQGA